MCTRPQRGVSLVELIVFIVVVGVAMAGLFAAFNTMIARSADPQVRKQVLAIAESLMEEIQLMPFTYCDPDDANIYTATSAAVGPTGCAATAEGVGQGRNACSLRARRVGGSPRRGRRGRAQPRCRPDRRGRPCSNTPPTV